MAPRHEQTDAPPGGWERAARLIGFVVLAGASLALLAGTLLLPEYERARLADWQRARQQAVNDHLQAQIAANERLLAALPEDPVLAKRMAMNQLGLWPEREVVVLDGQRPREVPGQARVDAPAPVPPPHDRLMDAAARLRRPHVRTAMLLLAAAAMTAAFLLFGRPDPIRRPSPQDA